MNPSTFVAVLGFASLCLFVDLARPALNDWFNSTRQIIKLQNINDYLQHKRNHAEIVRRMVEQSRLKSPSFSDIAACLNDFRTSPFYNTKKHGAAFKNVWICCARRDPETVERLKELCESLHN